jgi:mRNA-degrading endonuclease toxin of MazEF toxin-antitoxin module
MNLSQLLCHRLAMHRLRWHQYRTADKTRAGKYLGEISLTDMSRLEGALRQYLGL